MFGRLLGWYTIYIILGAVSPLMEFCQAQNSSYVQILRSPILAALLHDTRAAHVSQTLQRWALPIFGRAAIMLGIGPHSSSVFFRPKIFRRPWTNFRETLPHCIPKLFTCALRTFRSEKSTIFSNLRTQNQYSEPNHSIVWGKSRNLKQCDVK